MTNVGAWAIFISAALQVARRNKRLPSEFLMPLSFASLLGGSMTPIGTSPNLLASAVWQQLTGAPFEMFDFNPVGAGLAVIGVLFLGVGWRLLPQYRGAASSASFTIEDYTSEVRVPEQSPFVGRAVGEIERIGGGNISIAALICNDGRQQIPTRRWKLTGDDVRQPRRRSNNKRTRRQRAESSPNALTAERAGGSKIQRLGPSAASEGS